MNMTTILEALVALMAAVITAVVIPYIKSRTTANQQATIDAWIRIAVQGAEQIFNGPGKGDEKKAYVLRFLEQNGITLKESAVDAIIEAAVLVMNQGMLANSRHEIL